MGGISILLAVIFFYGAWVWTMRKNGTSAIVQWGGGFLATAIAFSCLASFINTLQPSAQEPSYSMGMGIAHADELPKAKLNISLSEWIQKMNNQLKELNMEPLSTTTDAPACNEWCTRLYQSGKNIGYMVFFRDDTIHEILSIANGDGSFKSGADVMFCPIALASVLSPNANKEKRGKMVMTMLGDALDGKKTEEKKLDGITYSAYKIEGMGLFFGATRD